MKWTADTFLIVASAAIVTAQILFRCAYRLTRAVRTRRPIRQAWYRDDSWMAVSFFPLIARTVCIAWYFELRRKDTPDNQVLSKKLVVPSRLTYAMFIWCMKLCLLQFYSRLENGSNKVYRARQALWCFLVVSLLIIFLATMLECRPLSLYWAPTTHACQKGAKNLLIMASFNIATDVALILFPIPMLWKMTSLSVQAKVQLTLLFLFGTVVIIITTTRLPLIFVNSYSQTSRTMWASIEIVGASVVANAAFYYALWKDFFRRRKNNSHSVPLVPYFFPSETSRPASQAVCLGSDQQSEPATSSDNTDQAGKSELGPVEAGYKNTER
ncbi:hypothetical protein LOZ58_001125 [Ophidiomyces ophidiicola]|nr:hypothetical protein LOZ65_001050 [Ophidiomyces ophidiicola]KAI1937255.1 hypothetical protein LOZ66_004173 [Ophidiomyces ophidiicola]KAI1965279.1 hypothetical protein LOZ58_001125 [Ophidiomyces ophidiicola]